MVWCRGGGGVCMCMCVWLFSFNYTIWRLYLFLTSFFYLYTLVALFECVRTYLFILFVFSFVRCLFLCMLSGKVLCLFIIIILLAHFVITFCFAVVKVMLVYFVFLFVSLCWKGDIVQHNSTWNNIWRAVFMRLCVSKSVFSILQILHLFCWLKFSSSIPSEDIERYRFRGREMVYLPWNCDKSFCQYNIIILLHNLGVLRKKNNAHTLMSLLHVFG